MKYLFVILLVSGFFGSFAQNKKLEGIWVEYKKELVGDTNNLLPSDHTKAYHFYDDTTYIIPGGRRDHDFYLSNDTIILCPGCFCDCNLPIEEYTYQITGSNKAQNNILVLSEINTGNKKPHNYYFRKARKLPSISKKR